MKVTLENFRCYHHKVFELPDRGLILLSGEKGKGKTTLIQSIIFGLYGECNVKPIAHGMKTCKVTLEYKEIKIVRSSKNNPYRLLVTQNDKEFTDDTAQTVINKFIGLTFEEFMATSYVVQRSRNSVITMTPVEQLKFIEKLAFTDDDTRKEYQKKFKNKIKECQEKISYTEGKINSLSDHYHEEKEKIPKNPLSASDDISIEELKSMELSLRKDINENNEKSKLLQEEIRNLKKEEERKSTILEQKKILDIELKQLYKKKEELGIIKSADEIDEISKKINSLIENIENMKKYISYNQCLERACKLRDEHIENLKKEIENIKIPSDEKMKELYEEHEKLLEKQKIYEEERVKVDKDRFFREHADTTFQTTMNEIKNTIPTIKTNKTHLIVNALNKKVKTLEKEIDRLEKLTEELSHKATETKIRGELYNCPQCNSSLFFEDGSLKLNLNEEHSQQHVSDEDINVEITNTKETLQTNKDLLQKMKGWLNTVKEVSELISKKPLEYSVVFNNEEFLTLRDKISDFQRKKLLLSEYQTLFENIEKDVIENYPSSIKVLFLEVEEKKKCLPKKFKPFSNLKSLEEELDNLKLNIVEERRRRNDFLSISKDISIREGKLKTIATSLSKNFLNSPEKNLENLENSLSSLRSLSVEYSEKFTSVQSSLRIAIDRENYQRDVKRLENLEKEITKSKNELKVYQRNLEGALGLLSSDKEAQILSLKTTISKINSYSKFYLEKIFEDDISVTLKSHKLSVKGDLLSKINTEIVYKGEKYDSFKELCGGESQQCELAFLFGVNDMLGSNMVFLDECLNNLDVENNMKAINMIKQSCSNKLIIVVAHEAVLGIFDKIIYF